MGFYDVYKTIRKYAVIYSTGGVAALFAMKRDIFSFPDSLRLYLGYFFSTVTIFCVFLTGVSAYEFFKNASETIRKINSMRNGNGKKKEDLDK